LVSCVCKVGGDTWLDWLDRLVSCVGWVVRLVSYGR
jgi:hypothetical protein